MGQRKFLYKFDIKFIYIYIIGMVGGDVYIYREKKNIFENLHTFHFFPP